MAEELRTPRADARRNRARILAAAETVLAREGAGASVRAVAAAAGVGLGTVYRHFPTQEALYQAVAVDRAHRLLGTAATLLRAEDAGAAFFDFFTAVAADAAREKLVADLVTGAGADRPPGTAEAARALRGTVEALLTRAQAAGALRADLRLPEVLALLGAACLAAERDAWPPALRGRALAVLFDGFRPRS
ncbi:TetR family transcriptional regulator [Streptomyces sp. B1866]|uniref:SbtR family transcriptional regulator n=1 Tax=Streptomyces sp. B1866 TaxID=3075431 RepID=UPI00288E8704|nr:TetR family transcriptional regulator [Streptomyces sp. B1866]MDT3400049.1 TetR family transcriptional regulator [Streptomyces sp. B1866]